VDNSHGGFQKGHDYAMGTLSTDLHLARDGQVTCRNHARLGYDRLARGVYGHLSPTGQLDGYAARRARFLDHVHAVAAAYTGLDFTLYGPTALQVLAVALPARLEDWANCHVLVPRDTYRPRRAGVVAHQTLGMPPARTRADGLPLLHPVDHWLQLRGATDDELVEVGDGLVRRNSRLTTSDLARHLDTCDGKPGVKTARRVLPLIEPSWSRPSSSVTAPGTDRAVPLSQLRKLVPCTRSSDDMRPVVSSKPLDQAPQLTTRRRKLLTQ
jgi:hypothetical protein